MPRRTALVLAGLVLLVVGGLVAWRLAGSGTDFEEAVALAPAGTERVSWTDWTAVRRELGADLDTGSTGEDVQAFLDEAFDRDLSSSSALVSSAAVLQDELGASPATIDWELLAQSDAGAVEVLRLGPEVDADELADRLERLGWQRPEADDGVWQGGPDVLAGVGAQLTPELQHVALLADDGLLVSSDQEAYLEEALAAVRGDAARVDGLGDVAADLAEPLAAVVYTGAHACEALAMAQADADARAEADQLVEAAGGVHPLTAFAMGVVDGDAVRVAMEVEDADDAQADAEVRARLASGPAPGQGGDFTDRFEVGAASAQGRVVRLDLEPREGEYVLSDLSSGPVLFATC